MTRSGDIPAGLSPAKRQLMERLRAKQAARAAEPRIPRRPEGTPVPLSSAQDRLWFLAELEPDSTAYNIRRVLELRGALDVARLERALSELVDRHEVLRTRYPAVGGRPVAEVLPQVRTALPVIDLAALPQAARLERARALAKEELARPFDLARGPLVRAQLLRLGPERHHLLLSMHHVVSDGWSLGVFFRELAALYEGTALPPLPIQYSDYAAWQRGRPENAGEARDLEHWKKELSGLEPLELPADRPRPAVATTRGARHVVSFPAHLGAALDALATSDNATLFMALLAAFEVLLHRYSGQRTFGVGTPVAGRLEPEVEGLVGCFVNTLVMRAELEGDPTFRELLGRVRSRAVSAYEHQTLPFERLVEVLAPSRDLGRAPLFQAMFVLRNTPADQAPALPGLDVEVLELDPGTSQLDLSLYLGTDPKTGALTGYFEYATDLFEARTIERLASHFGVLLEAIVTAPDTAISRLRLLSDEERHRLVFDWNDTAAKWPEGVVVTDLVSAQAAARPDAIAAVFEGEALGYAALEARSNQLAQHLAALGVEPGDLVGLALERSLSMLVALLAILKTGAAYVPLDPSFPASRLALMIADSGLRLAITETTVALELPVPLVRLDADRAAIDACPAAPLPKRTSPDALAYVLYTSGSTGRPKGVMIRHRSLSSFLLSMQRTPGLGPDDVLVAVTTISFDIAGLELYLPLVTGARVVIASRETAADGTKLTALLEQSRATVLQATPATWKMLQLSGWTRSPNLRALVGGEALPASLARDLLGRVREVWNLYGPTETTIWSTVEKVEPELLAGRDTVPIGRPIANTEVYVLDAALEPVPPGVKGELYIGGVGVAKGYLGQSELTLARFLPDPFRRARGSTDGDPPRLYKTGDLARRTADGRLEFLGRADHQVKLRGFRVELAEIEHALARHPDVREAVVIVREDTPGNQRLVGYVTPRPGQLPLAPVLRTFLREKLPDYMVPSAYVVLEALPLTPNGKVDRRALPAPESPSTGDLAPALPSTATEEKVAALYAEILGARRVGLHDDFFALGGHSLLATQLVSRLRAAFSREISLRTLFQSPTVAGLARVLDCEQEGRTAPTRSRPPPTRVPREGPLPLSFAQQRLWFLDRFEGESGAYNIPMALRVSGAVDAEALDRALVLVVERHEALRTTFPVAAGEPSQRVGPVPARVLRVEALDAASVDAPVVQRRIAEEAERPFDLEKDLLLRAVLLVLRGGEHVLLATMHHVAADGWSLGVFLDELGELYGALVRGEAPSLPPLPVQYADFAAWQRRHLDKPALAEHLAYWTAALEGAPRVLELPTDRPRPAVQRFVGKTRRFALDPELTSGLEALSRRAGVTTYMTLLAAWSVLLARLSGQKDVLVGSPIANRTTVEAERLIGCFINTLVLRTKVDDDPTFLELLARTEATALDAYAHQDLPFEHLIEALHPERSLAHTPLFQVMFILQNAPREPLALPGCTTSRIARDNTTSKVDLTLWMEETDGGLSGGLEYSTDLFDDETIERWVGHLQTLLGAITRAPATPVSRLPLLDDAEKRLLAETWNATALDYPAGGVHHLFEAQVDRRPDALAAEHGELRISYRELERRANQLAAHLAGLGVGPNVLVGLAVDRSLDLLVALLGVMKAGGAYVPLDPAFPRKRLEYMIQDSRMRVLVSETKVLAELGLELRGLPVVRLDADRDALESAPPARVARASSPDQLAYVIYTSGSTGRPKGVRVRHRSVVNFLTSMAKEPGLDARDALLAVTTISFDIAGLELYLPLAVGARVVLASRETAADGRTLKELLERSEATVLQATPSTWRLLLQAGWTGSKELRAFVGGEAVPAKLAAELLPKTKGVWNLYGPTETTIWSTLERVTPESLEGLEVVPIGRPIANTAVHVLDEARELVPIGVHGELYIGGDGLARGYHERPELTEERFVPDPFADPGDPRAPRLYKTGDRVRRLPDGRLEFLGRLDHQVKLRGFRIELGEVESVLAEIPALREVVAIVREDSPGDQRLVAYYVPRAGDPGTSELRSALKGKLPDYMIPSAFVRLDALPLTPNGKIDRGALPSPQALGDSPAVSAAGPRNGLELQLVAIWEKVLGVQPIGVHDDFFERGGHSLLAITLLDRIEQAFGRRLSLITLFRAPTVAQLAEVLAGNGLDAHAWVSLEAIQPRGDRPPLFFVGSTLYARAVSKAMGPEQPVYGLNIFGLHPTDGSEFTLGIPEIAARYVDDLRSVQKRGPYHLAGYCADAKIAFEMAQQLVAAGEEVAFLGFIDEIWRAERTVWRMLTQNLRAFGASWLVHKVRQRTRYTVHKAVVTASALERRLRQQLGAPVPLALQHEGLIKSLYQALGAYRPKPYPGKITLFLASESIPKYSPELERYALGGVEVLETPGYHITLFVPPQVDILAKQLSDCIQAAVDTRPLVRREDGRV